MASFGDATVHEVASEPAPEPAADAGELQTATSAAGADYVPATALEARIAEVIRGVTSKREQKPKFVKIQLQFPKVAAVFEKVRATFNEIDEDKSGTIELSEIKTALAKVSELFAPISPTPASPLESCLKLPLGTAVADGGRGDGREGREHLRRRRRG